ncbi:MAG: J domain-containing protein [Verrucomicrobia bacterium]|nr:MAG: J domain-containing protein [Verrucomicrobiota bacterium]MDH4469889.1 J domain-containing protein [Verrucomicrobiae bacterium]
MMAPTHRDGKSDPFALLELPRRPIVDLDLLDKNFSRLAATYHPDQQNGEAMMFQKIQEATRLLRHPAKRLRLLAGEATMANNIPAAAKDLFSSIGGALQRATEVTTKYHAASGPLLKALLIKDLLAVREELIAAQESLDQWLSSLDQELQEMNLRWPQVSVEELLSLSYAFLLEQRWDHQLREALFQTTMIDHFSKNHE